MTSENQQDIDQRLVERVQAGDKAAFDILVKKYQHKVISVASRYVYDYHEAVDVSQEAFIKAYRALPGFRGESAFFTWLYRIAINTAKNHLVSKSRRPPEQDIDVDDAQYFDNSAELKDIDTPENALYRDELQKVINGVLNKLPEELRVALTLREFDGLSYEDIAEIMNCPVGTVRSRIFRAREAIDKEISPLLQIR